MPIIFGEFQLLRQTLSVWFDFRDEGKERKILIWSRKEVERNLNQGPIFCTFFYGNSFSAENSAEFLGKTILQNFFRGKFRGIFPAIFPGKMYEKSAPEAVIMIEKQVWPVNLVIFFCSLRHEKRDKTETNMFILFFDYFLTTALLKHSFNTCLDCILLDLP
jgi:hypothetical protein